jgi:Flp pilus assembly pilin Flp
MKKIISSAAELRRNKSGQVLVEFAILAVLFALLAISAAVLLKNFSTFGRWLLNVVGVGYP